MEELYVRCIFASNHYAIYDCQVIKKNSIIVEANVIVKNESGLPLRLNAVNHLDLINELHYDAILDQIMDKCRDNASFLFL